MNRPTSIALLAVGFALAAACGSKALSFSPPTIVCEAGRQAACPCPGGAQGVQTCQPDGASWGTCEGCGGSGTGTGGATTTTTTSSTTTSSSSSSASSSTGTGGADAGQHCTTTADCPPAISLCATTTCTAGVCGVVYAPAGEPAPTQIPGNCAQIICDNDGNFHKVSDPTNVDDGNSCTVDACTSMGPSHTPVAPGTMCDGGLCQNDSCASHYPVHCSAGGNIATGCDGQSHPNQEILYTKGDGTLGDCSDTSTDIGYCPKGKPCTLILSGMAYAGMCL